MPALHIKQLDEIIMNSMFSILPFARYNIATPSLFAVDWFSGGYDIPAHCRRKQAKWAR